MKCLACGNSNLVEGTMNWTSAEKIKFKPSDRSLLQKMLGIGDRSVRAYACVLCRNLQLEIDFTDEDRKRYEEYQYTQPRSVVDEPALEGEGSS
jgi:hypothetical protein